MAFGGNPMSARWGKLYKQTPAEQSIEPALSAATGCVVRCQFPGYLYGFRFFPDFFLPQLGLIVEIDDPGHNRAAKILADADRTEALETRGWTVVRCKNEEALNDPNGTVQRLLNDAGITPQKLEAARRVPLSQCMPVTMKAGQRERRAAKHAARINLRKKKRN